MMTKIARLCAQRLKLIISTSVTAAIFVVYGCTTVNRQSTPEENIAVGEVLSKKYCVSCHQYPSPSLLDKHTWEAGVLPKMATQLGIQVGMGQYYADMQSSISGDDWQKILAFYKDKAPEKLVIPKSDAVKDWAIFNLRKPAKTVWDSAIAMTTMIKFNPFDKLLYTADAGNNLFAWDAKLNARLVKKMPSMVSAAEFFKTADNKNTGVFTCIGVLPPNDYLKGSLQQLDLSHKKPPVTTLADSLPRSVQMASGDFNKDSLTDYIVCGYGNTKGGLYLVQQQADHSFKKHIIRAIPGAIQVQTGDFNNDGWLDVMCLFAQADEGIWMFLNDKKGGFTTSNLLHFPPVYGSNNFQLVDVNNDGKKDIIYTCGDNSDYSLILKPYHGIYIFTNQGNWKFKQTWFYQINGCSKAVAADFDGDGDMDIATIAFFADFKNHPYEGFTYFEQTAAGKFKAHEIPVNAYGRWISMEVADIDLDGDPDVVLGNFSILSRGLINQRDFKPNWDMHKPFIVLQNNAGKASK